MKTPPDSELVALLELSDEVEKAIGAYEHEAFIHGRTGENALAVDAAADRLRDAIREATRAATVPQGVSDGSALSGIDHATLLVARCLDMNAESAEYRLDGVTDGDHEVGDWLITVAKTPPPAELGKGNES